MSRLSRVLIFLLVCQSVPAQVEHLMVKGTYAEREAVGQDAEAAHHDERVSACDSVASSDLMTRPKCYCGVTRKSHPLKIYSFPS